MTRLPSKTMQKKFYGLLVAIGKLPVPEQTTWVSKGVEADALNRPIKKEGSPDARVLQLSEESRSVDGK